MLTIGKIKNGVGYAGHHLSHNDYYEEGKHVTGQWMGHGAEKLGLTGEVSIDDLNAVRKGCDPATGDFIRQRQSGDRLVSREINGKPVIVEHKAVHFYDCTISAPKDVSILSMLDLRVAGWHE